MRTSILGWGSLIWDPRSLPIRGGWRTDGPSLPVEFCRISASWPLTLVIRPGWRHVDVLYTISDDDNLDMAIVNLARREGCGIRHIGCIDLFGENDNISSDNLPLEKSLRDWMASRGLDAVIWTDLPSNFESRTGSEFTIDNGLRHLRSLCPEDLERALHYITSAPEQIRTPFRDAVYKEFLNR